MYWNKFAPIILACVQVNMTHIYNEGPIGLTYMPVFFLGKYLRNKIASQFNSWPLQTILSIFSLPLIPQNNVEATQEVSLPLQALPPSRTYHFLSGSSDDGGMKSLTSQHVSFPFLSSLALPENSQLSSLQPLLSLPPYKELSCLWRITYPNRECPVHPTRVQHVGCKMLTDVLWFVPAAWDGFYTSHYENKENEIFLRKVKATHPVW